MAEAVIGSIAEKIIDILGSQAIETVGKLCGVKRELKALMDTVSMLWPVLDHAEEQYHQIPHIRIWVEKLKDGFYEAEDVLEEFKIEAMRRELRGHSEIMKEVRTFFSSSNQLAFKLKMSDKVRAVRERIQAIKNEKDFYLDERLVDLRAERERRKREETHSFIGEGDIIGRDDDKKKVVEFLLDSDVKEDVSILPIVGIGGLGKTALAQFVYNDEMVCGHFDLKIWVCVSNDFDVKNVVKNILTCVKKEEPNYGMMERLQSELRAAIDGRRYLLVLDDLWDAEPETWLRLKTLLVGGARGSKILITTRLPSVAKFTCTASPLHLGELSESVSFDLLMQMSGRKKEEIQDLDMLAIGKEIVKNCSGVPLVVRTVGRLLFFKETTHEWLHFKDHELSKVAQKEEKIESVLRLSYDHLPSHLKQCFAFCSLFPKDYEMEKCTLVNLWVAEGFIQPSDRSQQLEDIAHDYFMDLLWRNFFQEYKNPYPDWETCKMHDLMHDLACSVAGTECRVAWDNTKSIQERTHHISHGLTSNLLGELSISHLKSSALRTFLSTAPRLGFWEMEQREPSSEADLRQLIQNFKRLRILDMHSTNIKKVPRSICKLKHLTYLDFSSNNALRSLSKSITGLQNLQTLNLIGCDALEELPAGIRKLVSLRNIDINYCGKLSYMPSGLGQLSSLNRVTRFILPQNKTHAKKYCKLAELNGLNNIRGSLSIEHLRHVKDVVAESKAANLIGKHSLNSLKLLWGLQLEQCPVNQGESTDDAAIGDKDKALLDGLRPHSNLKELEIDGYKGENFPRWMMDSLVLSLPNLVVVIFRNCSRCKYLPQLGQLPHLKFLHIWQLIELEYIESADSSTLTTSFPSLSRLRIVACEKLKAIPRAPHLERLDLLDVNPELINQIFSLNKLKELRISGVESLEFLPEEGLRSLTSLESLSIDDWQRLTSLSLGLRHLSSLRSLSIWDCEELDISKDESGNILDFHGLHTLRSLGIMDLPKLASLPQWLLQLSNLESLEISRCSNLKDLTEQIEALQSLQRLEITRCPSLTSLPEGMQRLASLTHLKIADCPELEERCKRDAGEDWRKIAHIPNITHKEYD